MFSKFILKPLQNVSQNTCTGKWQVTNLPCLVELVPECAHIPSGWVLMQGHLPRWGSDFSARLFAEVQGAKSSVVAYDIPITRKGSIFELIKLPAGVQRLFFQPMNSCGEFELRHVFLKPVSIAERIARMMRRVVPVFFKQPAERRQKIGLSVGLPLVNLPKAYQLAGRFRAYSPALPYNRWIEEFDLLTDDDRRLILRDSSRWQRLPRFCVLIDCLHMHDTALQATLRSLRDQLYPHFEVTLLLSQDQEVLPPLSLSGSAYTVASRQDPAWFSSWGARQPREKASCWLVVLQPGVILPEHALYWLASETAAEHAPGLIYSDHDSLDSHGQRLSPVFKPDWSPELLRSTNYIGQAAAIRADLLEQAGGLSFPDAARISHHDLLLRVTEQLAHSAICHIPAVLFHLPVPDKSKNPCTTRDLTNPVAAHLARLGVAASVEKTAAGHFRVRYALPPSPPLISIIVPTRDALPHLRACVDSVLTKTTYRNFELLVIDNQSREPQTLEYLAALAEDSRVQIHHYDEPFNYSAINNFAVAKARGEAICLLNNDTEVISADWLETMLGHLAQPGVGVVGAKLYFSDGRVQHAGDTVGPGGCAHHLHSFLNRDAPGYCDRAVLAQDLSAVTAACLLTWRGLFVSLGGLNAGDLPVAFNDVDYCLRVREAGYRVVWTPFAELYHHESVSRGADESQKKIRRARGEVAYMRKRWQHVMNHDPFYNPNLSYERPDFSLSTAPMVKKPWLA